MAGVLQSVEQGALLPGFFLRVTPQVTWSFGIVYTTREGRLRRCTLGPVGIRPRRGGGFNKCGLPSTRTAPLDLDAVVVVDGAAARPMIKGMDAE